MHYTKEAKVSATHEVMTGWHFSAETVFAVNSHAGKMGYWTETPCAIKNDVSTNTKLHSPTD